MKTKLTKIIMSSLAFACALVCLVATMAPGTSATARAAADGQLQRGHAKGLVSVDLRRVRKLRWEPGTESRYARPPVQRRWYDVQSIRHCEHRGHDYYRRHRRGRNLYSRSGLHRHPVNRPGMAPTFNIYVGPGAQQVWTLETSPNPPAGIGVSVGTATRVP